MKEPKNEAVFYCLSLETKHIEPIVDDDQYIISSVITDVFGTDREFSFRVQGDTYIPEAFYWGGVAAFTNLRPELLRKALALGLDFLVRTGQISEEDFKDAPTVEGE